MSLLLAKLGEPDKYENDVELQAKADELVPIEASGNLSYRANLIKIWADDLAKRTDELVEENTEDARRRYEHFLNCLRGELEFLVDILHGGYDSLKPAKSVERIGS